MFSERPSKLYESGDRILIGTATRGSGASDITNTTYQVNDSADGGNAPLSVNNAPSGVDVDHYEIEAVFTGRADTAGGESLFVRVYDNEAGTAFTDTEVEVTATSATTVSTNSETIALPTETDIRLQEKVSGGTGRVYGNMAVNVYAIVA